jgi:hypothetical protein
MPVKCHGHIIGHFIFNAVFLSSGPWTLVPGPWSLALGPGLSKEECEKGSKGTTMPAGPNSAYRVPPYQPLFKFDS